jgi:alkanesulfonate monooxygenase SsuD/methylene tetrahydromethanopterin reductase-like flavin-dependent oxidoreductase (luciferase family)
MRNGIVLFTSDRGITPAQLAVAAEERGFDTIYVPEHTHIPVRRDAAHPTGGTGLPDDRYLRTLDPWVSLATCARHADGWVTTPIETGIAASAGVLREEWAEAGRDGEPEVRILVSRKPTEDDFAEWTAAGACELIWGVPDADPDVVLSYLDKLAGRLGLNGAGAPA